MQKNVGSKDKIIRYVLAVLMVVLAIKVSWLFWIMAIAMAGTAFLGICPLYQLLGVNTNK